jgi:hypothetical protein
LLFIIAQTIIFRILVWERRCMGNDETLAIWISKGFLFYVRPFCMHFYSILTIHKLS